MTILPLMPSYMASRMINENVRPNMGSISAIKGTFDLDALRKKCLWLPFGERMSWNDIIERKINIDRLTNPIVSSPPAIGSFPALDHQLYRIMYDCFPEMTPSLASRQEVWNTINVGLFPHIVIFRWGRRDGNFNSDRFISANRNYFGSMWWRTYFFYDESSKDPYGVLDNLKEDDFVQIMERVKLRGYPGLAKAIGQRIVKLRKEPIIGYPGLVSDVTVRQSIVDLRVQALGIDFNSITDIREVVEETFDRILRERKREYNESPINFITKYKNIR